ncbi:hypothetical protein BDM02DRAFT_3270450 [Thelephora ganbajun]|uniref:Uncharacterized protein n=1 Tax=Thelephora ganbajun TaxID=370292 RepID=A0ACB6ZCE9_THEGA|nr:hypothetical protein BDM02DRAFT_3270450 [Thelephora ganbajun]
MALRAFKDPERARPWEPQLQTSPPSPHIPVFLACAASDTDMVELNLEQVLETTDTVVQELLATGELDHLTFKDVLLRIDTRLELPRGTLLRYEHKSTVKELIKGLVAGNADDQPPSPPKKKIARPEPEAAAKSNKRRKTYTKASDREGSDNEPEPKKVKKSPPIPKAKAKEVKVDKASKTETKKASDKSKTSGKVYKAPISVELVDSDLDDTDPGLSTSKPPTSTSSPKKLNLRITDSESETDSLDLPRPTKPRSSLKQPKEKQQKKKYAHGILNFQTSDSEVSSLFNDEPPKRRRKAKGEKDETKPKGARQKKEKKELSKDEETIKRLKSLVVACGVRKVWSKEFKGLDKPSAQIKRLNSILSELGMTGRMSMEQARAIKAKREFAQELEDVKDFEKKVVGGSEGRSSRKKLGSGRKDVESSDEDDEGDEDDKPRKKRIKYFSPQNARNSINAFLEDQSDED